MRNAVKTKQYPVKKLETEQKRAEGALRESAERFRSIVENSHCGIMILDDAYRFIYVNDELCRISGYPRDEIIGQDFRKFLDEESRQLVADRYLRRQRGEEVPPRYEFNIVCKDSQKRRMEISSNVIKDSAGKAKTVAQILDITERKQMEEVLQAEKNKLKSVIDAMEDGLTIQDKDYNIIYQNEPLKIIFGDHLGEKCYRVYEGKEKLCDGCPVEKAFRDGKSHTSERRVVIPSREVTFWENTANPIRDASGSIISCLEINRNITERKKAEQALADEATRRRILIDQSLDGIVILDENSKVYEANQRFTEMLGYTPEEVRELHTWDWDTQWTREELLEMGRKVDATGYHLETYHRRKDGTTIDVEISINGAICAGQKLIFCVCRDITERKQAEEKLREAEEEKSALLEEAPIAIFNTDLKGKITYVNKRFESESGYSREEIIGKNAFKLDWFSEGTLRYFMQRMAARLRGKPHKNWVTQFKCKDGRWIWIETEGKVLRKSGVLVGFQIVARNITERKKREQLQLGENSVLTLLGQGAELSELLDAIVRLGEQNDPSIKGSVLLFDSSKELLFLASAPSLPDDYQEVFENGLPLGPNVGSCGTAAYLKERVIVTDIANSPLFKPFEEAAKRAVNDSLLAVWSQPIIASNGNLLGTIANYSNKVGEPSADNIRVLEWSTRIAAIAIERKQAEEALRQSEKKYKNLAEATSDLIWEADEGGTFTFVSPRIKDVLGYEAKEVIGKIRTLDLIPKAEAREWLKRFKEINAKKEPFFGFEITHLHKNGTPVLFEISGISTFDNAGNFKGYVGVNKNITERKQAEEKIRSAAEEWRTTFNSITDFISIHDKDNRIVRVNKAFADAFKTTPDKLVGKLCHQLSHGTKEPPENCPHRQTLKTGKPATMEVFDPNRGIYIQESTSPIFDEKGNVAGLVHIAKNITERKRMEEQLMLTDRLASIGELASGIAHELNNPLTSVIGFSQLLLEEDIPENLKEDLGTIYSEAQRASAIVKNLLTFARKHAPMRQISQVNNILEDVLKLRAYEHKVNNIELEKNFAAELPEIMVDYFQMQQVFLNLIVNAESAMLEANGKGKLAITTGRVNNTIKVSVADNGPGIAKENLRRVFDPFFTTKEVGKGTGLGLSICHGIVTGHGGKIYAEGEAKEGATFVVELPLDGN